MGVTQKLAKQYGGPNKSKKGEILNTMVRVTGYNRCYAGWLMRHWGRRLRTKGSRTYKTLSYR